MSFGTSDKLAFVFFSWTCAFCLPWQVDLAAVVLIVVLEHSVKPFRPVSATSHKYFTQFLVYSILFLTALVLVNGLLVHEGPVALRISFANLYTEGIHYGLTVATRLVLLSLSILSFFVSIRFQDFVQYLQTAGLPNAIVSIVLLTLYFLEQLPNRISLVFTAQEARGAPVRKGILSRSRAFFVILSPLVLSSIAESIERGTALELRGYRSYSPNIVAIKSANTFHWWRYGFIALSIIIIIFSVMQWLSL